MTTGINLRTADSIAVGEDITIDEIGNSKIDRTNLGAKMAKFKNQDKSKGKNLAKSKSFAQSPESGFLSSKAKQTFTELRQAFIKARIFHYFDPDYHIRIETDVFGYAIGRVLSHLTLNNLG